jgi:hypothetical protein
MTKETVAALVVSLAAKDLEPAATLDLVVVVVALAASDLVVVLVTLAASDLVVLTASDLVVVVMGLGLDMMA